MHYFVCELPYGKHTVKCFVFIDCILDRASARFWGGVVYFELLPVCVQVNCVNISYSRAVCTVIETANVVFVE